MVATQVTVTATFNGSPGRPQSQASLQWQLSGTLFDAAGLVICTTQPIPFPLNSSGHGSVVLWAVDDPTSQPQGLFWTLSGTIGRQPFSQSYAISYVASPVDVASLTQVQPTIPFTSYAAQSVVTAEVARAEAAEASNANLLGGTPYLRVYLFGAKGDTIGRSDGAMTAGSAVLGSATGTFSAADVGKTIVVGQANSAAGDGLVTTIASVQSVAQATCAAPAVVSVSSAHYCYGTDDTAAFNAATVAAGSLGNNHWGYAGVPMGRFMIVGQLVISRSALCGLAVGPFDVGGPPDQQSYAPTLIIANTTTTPVKFVGNNSAITDIAMYWPAQVPPTASAPVAFPWAITVPSNSAGHKIMRVSLFNAYDGLDLAGGRHFVDNVNLSCFHETFKIDHSYDVIHVKSVHVGQMWNGAYALAYPQAIDTWVQANRTLAHLYRADNPQFVDIFGFIGNIGLLFDDSSDGTQGATCSYGVGSNITLDTWNYGIQAKATASPGWELAPLAINALISPVNMVAGGSAPPVVRGTALLWGTHQTPLVAAGSLVLHVPVGPGQATNAFSTTGAMGGSLALLDNGAAINNGAALMLGAGAGYGAAVKYLLVNNANNTQGDLIIATRNVTTDATLSERLRIKAGGDIVVNATGLKLTATGHIVAANPFSIATTIANGAGIGGTPGAPSIVGADTAGQIAFTTGTAPTADAVMVTVTFAFSFGTNPHSVVYWPANAAAAANAGVWTGAPGTDLNATAFNVRLHAPAAGTTYVYNYIVIG